MTEGVVIARCTRCAWQGLPIRFWCPSCRSFALDAERVTGGRAAETTTVRRSSAAGNSPTSVGPVRLGAIYVDGGGVILARLHHDVVEGERVTLDDDSGVAVARHTPT